MAATTERMKAADTWRTEAGLQLLQLLEVHDLKVPVHEVFSWVQHKAPEQLEAELQALATTTFWPLTVPAQE